MDLEEIVPEDIMAMVHEEPQRAIPRIAKAPAVLAAIQQAAQGVPTHHGLHLGDSRTLLRTFPDRSVHLVVTSPPYWNLKEYEDHEAQLGHIDDYADFLDAIGAVWTEVHRMLVPGGRLVIVVGDVCLSRRQFGRHVVFPLHASIQEQCRAIGFDNLAPIIWHKITNASFEVENGSGFLGKPYEPNAVIKNDVEYILFQRKPGGYRKPSQAARVLSIIPANLHREWFRQIWTIGGASTREHPAPYPLELAERLIRMFSFVGDTVLDPFVGTGTTSAAAKRWGRNSIGIEIDPTYMKMADDRIVGVEPDPVRLPL